MPGPQPSSLETIPREIRCKILQELAWSEEFQLGPGGSRDVANILQTSKGMRQDGLMVFNRCCTVSYMQGNHIPYLPRYFHADLIRHVAFYLPQGSWAPTPPVTAMFPSLRVFKLVYDPGLLIFMPDPISKLAHQMASLSPLKKACISFILYMMDHPIIRPTMILEQPTDNSDWANHGYTLYKIPFTASLGFHSDPNNPGVSGSLVFNVREQAWMLTLDGSKSIVTVEEFKRRASFHPEVAAFLVARSLYRLVILPPS